MHRRTVAIRTLPKAAWICLMILALLFCCLLWRCPYGFDWSDEPYQVEVPYRILQGDRPIADTWEVHQFSGLLSLPFLRIFLLASGGSTDGVLLYFRYIALLGQFLSAVYCFFVLRRWYGECPALLASCMLLLHAHYAMNNFFYNPQSLIFLTLSCLMVLDGQARERGGWWIGLGGACYTLSVMAQPYLLLALPVYGVYWWLWIRSRKRAGEKNPFRQLGFFALGMAAVGIGVLGAVWIRCPLKELWGNLSGMLGDPDHGAESVPLLMAKYLNAVRVLFGPASYLAAALAVYGLVVRACRFQRPETRLKLQRMGLWGCIGLLVTAVVWILPYDYPGYHKINLAAMAASLLFPALYLLSGGKKDRSILLFFLGCALSVAVQLGSNTRVRASTGMMLPASMGAVLYLFVCIKTLYPQGKAGTWCYRGAVIACAALAGLIGWLRMSAVYRDEPIPALTATMETGPAKGLKTTPEQKTRYERICAAIVDNAPEQGNLLITNLLPFGYLLTELTPATPSTFNMTMDTEWLWMYYEAHPDRMPDYIFCVDAAYGVSNDLSLQGAERFDGDPSYEKKELAEGTVFLRKEKQG